MYGREAAGAVETMVRKVTRISVGKEISDRVTKLMMERKSEVEEYFEEKLSEAEEPQFLRYQPGDYFIPHQDGNTPLIFDDSRLRKISAVIFLNTQSTEPTADTYTGGALVLHGAYPDSESRFPVPNEPGTLVAFRAQTTHEVTPVEHGERYSIVSWYR